MEELVIHCPKCSQRLSVPEDSAGRAARCPACKHVFQVPRPGEMMDESVVAWLNLDRLDSDEDAEEKAEAEAEKANSKTAKKHQTAKASGRSAKAGSADKPIRAVRVKDDDDEEIEDMQLDEILREAGLESDERGSFLTDETVEATDPPTDQLESASKKPRSSDSAPSAQSKQVKSNEAPASKSPPAADSPAKSSQAVMSRLPESARKGDSEESYSGRIAIPAADKAHPKLYVVDVGNFGVRFGFDSKLIDLPNFRASMPYKCMVTGETDPSKLVAKPLIWLDKNTGKFVNPGEMETRYEHKVKTGQSAREITESMRTIDELPPPFNQPIPYFIAKEQAGKHSIHAESYATTEGLRCELVIPHAPYALEWMGRVNGVIGDDYSRLETEVLKFQAKAWRVIDLQVRHRIAVWFDFLGNEQFEAYFNDGDFAKADAGLAGLVVTDRRLVWCKYHQHGELQLDEPVQLIAHSNGAFYDLKLRRGTSVRKMIRMRLADLKALQTMLERIGAQVELAIREDSGPG